MHDTIQEVIEFAKEASLCYLASIDGHRPRVRVMQIFDANETGFYFQTFLRKELPFQLVHNPCIELCFYKPIHKIGGTILRISGKIEFVDSNDLREKMIKERPFMKYLGVSVDSPEVLFFRITRGEACFWNLDNILQEKVMIKFSLDRKQGI